MLIGKKYVITSPLTWSKTISSIFIFTDQHYNLLLFGDFRLMASGIGTFFTLLVFILHLTVVCVRQNILVSHFPVLGCVHFENCCWGEGLLASLVDALDDAWGVGLVSHWMSPHFHSGFENLAAELTLENRVFGDLGDF
jgi:hypothetical protein